MEDHSLLIRFERSFTDLQLILRRNGRVIVEPSTPTQILKPADTPISSPGRVDPQEGSPASTISKLSAKAEHHTHAYANSTVSAAHHSLVKHLTKLAWFKAPMKALPLCSILMMLLILSTEQTMYLKLGPTRVTAKSDGGSSFFPESSSSTNYPIFCIEVRNLFLGH